MKYKVGDEFEDVLGRALKIVRVAPELVNCYEVEAKFGDYWHSVGFYNEKTFAKKFYERVRSKASHPLTTIFK